jgi:hypothetical protein
MIALLCLCVVLFVSPGRPHLIHQTEVKGRQLSVVACTLALSVAIPWPKASAEATNTTPSKTPPTYIEADRSDADQVRGSALTDYVFSNRFTALRKQLVATSLRGNPAPGCEDPPVFTLEVVSPEKPTSEGSRGRRPTPSAARSVCAERFCCSSL